MNNNDGDGLNNGLNSNADYLNRLIEGFLKYEESSTEELVNFFYKKVFYKCLKIVKDENAADDLTHDTFIKALKYRNSFDKNQSFICWLFKISSNLCINYFNSQSKKIKRNVYIDALETEVHSVKQLHDILIDKKTLKIIDQKIESEIIAGAVSLLPLIYRLPIILHYYNDFSYEEIARILNKPIGTIKFRLHRAKAFLMTVLEPPE